MRNRNKTVIALAAMLFAASAYPAMAICSDAWVFGTAYVGGSPNFSYVETPGVNGGGVEGSSITANFRGAFWSLGAGNAVVDAAVGGGDDSGSFPAVENGLTIGTATGWFVGYPGAAMAGTWQQDPRINGCIINTAGTNCMVALLSDTDGAQTYFAIVSGQEDGLGFYDMGQAGGDIVLAPLPKPRITGSSRVGNDVTINIGAPLAGDLDNGKYLSACGANALTGYKLYRRTVTRGAGVGAGRNPGDWTSLGAAIPVAQGTSVAVDCSDATNQDVYLTQTLVTDGGFEVSWVSQESTRVECGPQIAEPRPAGRPATPQNDRVPGRGGRR